MVLGRMRRGLIYLNIVFISIILLSIFIKRTIQEPFVILKDDVVLEAIDIVKSAFTMIETAAKKQKKNVIQTKKETKLVSYVVKKNKENLDVLAATYESMDEYNIDSVSIVNYIQANLNEYIEIYNYINGKLVLNLQAMKTNMIVVPTAQVSQKKFNQMLALSPPALNKELKMQLANKVSTTVSTKLPVQSALHPPRSLIKVTVLPPVKDKPQKEEKPIFDIYDQLMKVYGPKTVSLNKIKILR